MASAERKRCSYIAPVRRLRSLVWMKARRLPGVRCSTLKTACRSLLCLMTMPGRSWVAGIAIEKTSPCGMVRGCRYSREPRRPRTVGLKHSVYTDGRHAGKPPPRSQLVVRQRPSAGAVEDSCRQNIQEIEVLLHVSKNWLEIRQHSARELVHQERAGGLKQPPGLAHDRAPHRVGDGAVGNAGHDVVGAIKVQPRQDGH